MENMRKGFMTAIVLVMMVVASMLLLVLYQGVANYRENAMYTLSSIQNDADSINIMNIGVGFLKPKSLGILGIPLLYNDNVPTWFNDFKSKLNQDWQNYITTYVSTTKACKIYDWSSTGGQDSGLIKLENASNFLSEITSYINQRKPYQISLYAFPMKQSGSTTVFLISMVKRQYRTPNNQYKYVTTYTYCLIGPKLLNQYVYFTNKETGSDDKPIYFTGGELIDGPMRSNDYIYIDNTNGNPTFNGTIEFKGMKTDIASQPISESNYEDYANLGGLPKYRILSNSDTSGLDFSSIASEYKTNLQTMVKPYSDLQTSPATPTGIQFTKDITLSFNHDTGSDYDLLIYEGSDVDKSKIRYKIKWKPSGPPNATVVKETKSGGSWSPSAPVDTLFNGVVYSTGNINIDSNNSTYLSEYYGNYTLYSEADIKIKDRLIPYDTYNKYFKNDQAKPLSSSDIESIKKYVSANEKSSLNLVAKNNVIVSEPVVKLFRPFKYYKLDNMKIFASIYAFNGSFEVADYDSDSSAGQLFTFGSIMQNARGPVGTFNSSTGQTQTGYYKTYVYDPRLTTAAYQPAGTPAKNSSAKIQVLGIVKSNN
ncbi:MAG TPA: hypothetical protein PKW84_07950 [Fervidobacterium sp.]|nr:hypothetical protein [Fervidobacterium sp.]